MPPLLETMSEQDDVDGWATDVEASNDANDFHGYWFRLPNLAGDIYSEVNILRFQ